MEMNPGTVVAEKKTNLRDIKKDHCWVTSKIVPPDHVRSGGQSHSRVRKLRSALSQPMCQPLEAADCFTLDAESGALAVDGGSRFPT